MAILKIARMGHPVLLREAEAVRNLDDPEIERLVRDMAETLEDAGGVGLAAPQIFASLRLFIYLIPEIRDESAEPVPLTVVFNPLVMPLTEERELGWEGCLSIPGLRAAVPRFKRVRLSGQNARGEPFERDISGFHARVVQHEYDHLNGVLYPMRMGDFGFFGFTEETLRYPRPLPEIAPAGVLEL
jgi:peptide deformylase